MNLVIIQARMSSTRLPKKVMLDLNGEPVLKYVHDRVSASKNIDKVIVATSVSESDVRIVQYCEANGIECFTGSENDVLDRFYQAAAHEGLTGDDNVVRITADCPFLDPSILDIVIAQHFDEKNDYTSNIYPPTYPDGMDVEIFRFEILANAWKNASLDSEREHVTQYIVKRREAFKIGNHSYIEDLSAIRLTLDEKEDYDLINTIYNAFGYNKSLQFEDILAYLEKNGELLKVNQKYSRNSNLVKQREKEYKDALREMIDNKTILITGGTGSFGNQFVNRMLEEFNPKKLIIYSRDEFKQYTMKKNMLDRHGNIDKLRFFIGDVRDRDRLYRACKNVDYIIHAAALKQVPACEYNPFEAVKTNILGAENVIEVALDRDVLKVVALSTDKAVNPINLYGGTKLVSDKIFISANAYSGGDGAVFSVVRYGNVAGSRGSVIPFFKERVESGSSSLPITDFRMTRFWITLNEGVDLVLKALYESRGGETYISKIPSFKITDLAKSIGGKEINMDEVGIREGEKLHEVMVTREDSLTTYEYDKHYIIYPNFDWWDYKKHFTHGGVPVPEGFEYSSDNNVDWLTDDEMRNRLEHLY